MAVTKFWPVRKTLYNAIRYAVNPEKTTAKAMPDDLKMVLSYAADEGKTEQCLYVSGINCVPDIVYEQMTNVKKQFGKEDGILAWHAYMSFAPGEVIPEQAHAIGVELGERLWGERFQVLVTTHLNTHCIHNHLIVNSVSFADGKRLREKAWFINRKVADEICQKHRLSVVENPTRNPNPEYLVKQDQAGSPTRYNLARQGVDEAIKKSTSLIELARNLKEMGYGCNFGERLKYWTVTPKGYDKPIRLYRLGEDYTNDRIRERLMDNRGRMVRSATEGGLPEWRQSDKGWEETVRRNAISPAGQTGTRRQAVCVSRPKKTVGHLKGLYLHYCYRLGILPKKRQYRPRVHYLLREDLMKLDQISAEVRLMGRYHIGTEDDLLTFHEETKEKMIAVYRERKQLRNEMRRVGNGEKVPELRARAMELTKVAAQYRQELKLAEGIAERSGVMEEQLRKIREEKEKGKVKHRYEQRR